MIFSSLLFMFRFLPAVILLYYIVPGNMRNLVLFLGSLVFYAWGEPVYVVLIIFSSLVDYIAGMAVAVCRLKGYGRGAVLALCSSVCINLGLLGFFKYGNFILCNISRFTGMDMSVPDVALPIGISFYTFQTMSYTIDVYRGDAKVQKNFITFGAYVAMFPQLIAGPVIRYKDLDNELRNRTESVRCFSDGVLRFAAGLGKKVLIANQVGNLWNEIAAMGGNELTASMAWLGAVAFSLQIYFDFSGYSDMAVGLGAMFGFHFPENFNYPYESASVTEFWRRWHITLGTWFREYVYIPLGGNKKGVCRHLFNITVVWLLTGLWHGAYWNFILWGAYYGAILLFEKYILGKLLKRLPAVIGHIYTIIVVVCGWILFSVQDMADRRGYLKALLFRSEAGLVNDRTIYLFLSNAVILIIAAVGSFSIVKNIFAVRIFGERTLAKEAAGTVFAAAVLLLCTAMLVNSAYNPFLYFRF